MCSVEGCDKKVLAKGYCSKHYSQVRAHGEVQKRTVRDRNEYRIEDEITYILLYNKDNEVIAEAIIDTEDLEKVLPYKWSVSNCRGTSQYCKDNTVGQLQGFILGLLKGDGKYVDHINRNPLDNRKCNLRLCTNQENIRNCKIPKNNKSGHKGVYWSEERQKWVAQVSINRKTICLGRFISFEEAVEKRKEAVKEHYGEFNNEN